MATLATPVDTLFERIENYARTSLELVQLYTVEKSADVVSTVATELVYVAVISMFVLTVNIGLALWLGSLLGQTYYGFFVVALTYALLALLLHFFKSVWIKSPINNALIDQMLKQHPI